MLVSTLQCEACRAHTSTTLVDDDDPSHPYRVCDSCASRLRSMSLRPLEWFNVAAIHGPFKFLLHDDFYDDGVATCPEEPVVDAEHYPAPTLDQLRNDLERLIDYAMTQVFLSADVIDVLASHEKSIVLAVVQQRAAAPKHDAIECRAYELAAMVLGRDAEAWIRERWDTYRPAILFALAQASAACLPAEEGFNKVAAVLSDLPLHEKRAACNALGWFRSEWALAWLETHVEPPIMNDWGHLAALSQISWPWICRWLDLGRPMSLVALDALINCCSYNTMMLDASAPQLRDPAPLPEMRARLELYAQTDDVPRVHNRVKAIIEAWDA